MPKRAKIAYRNRNQTGWWIYCEVERWISDRQKRITPRSRFPVWENTRLIRARNREEAYRKALRLGKMGHPSRTNAGEWQFVGISVLLPVYEELEDGCEVLWHKRGLMSRSQITKLVKAKKQLLVFDDTDCD